MSNRPAVPAARLRVLAGLVLVLVLFLVLSLLAGLGPDRAVATATPNNTNTASNTATSTATSTATAGQPVVPAPNQHTVRVRDTDGTVHTLTLSAGTPTTVDGQLPGYFSTKTGVTYQGRDVWTTTYHACIGEGVGSVSIWRECMSFRVYFNGLSVWGRNHTLAGLTGSLICHSDGSYGYGFDHRLLSCGEHNLSSSQMKDWYSFDECTVPDFNCNYRAFHVNFYASGGITGPYFGLGA